MSEVGLHRCECARAVDPIHLGDTCIFNGVTDRGAGAVRFDHADRRGVHATGSQRRSISRNLCGLRRRRDIDRVAILICGRATNYRQDPVTVGQCIRQPLEHHHGTTLA
ncbi:hypothetical protein MRGA423_24140 [Mycobacterium tuberculosis RGTB423]|nr:hypothetical protein MRGA423_24140 [Mycobacterium tuberculosis RGTB423]